MMNQLPLLLASVMVCRLSGDCRRPPASMMSCRLSCSDARSPLRSIDTMVMLTFCDVTARNPCWIRRSSSAPRLGLIDRKSARSFDSIARAYAATTRRMAVSSLTSGGATGEGAGLTAADSTGSVRTGGVTGAGADSVRTGGVTGAETGGAGGGGAGAADSRGVSVGVGAVDVVREGVVGDAG